MCCHLYTTRSKRKKRRKKRKKRRAGLSIVSSASSVDSGTRSLPEMWVNVMTSNCM